MGWWDKAKYVRKEDGKSIEIACTPCQHWANRTLTDKCKTLWASWAVIGKKQRVFFAGSFIYFYFLSFFLSLLTLLYVGDTGYCSVFKKIGKKYGPFDVGLVPIGAYCPRYFMSPQHVDPKGMLSYNNITFSLPLSHTRNYNRGYSIASWCRSKSIRGDALGYLPFVWRKTPSSTSSKGHFFFTHPTHTNRSTC